MVATAEDPKDPAGVVPRLRDGGQVVATWCSIDSPAVVEVIAAAGFPCVLLDLEHGEFDTPALPGLLRAAAVAGATGIVRVRAREQIGPALDAGAAGVLVPDVRSAAAAAQAVQAGRYPPDGERGSAPMVRDARYGHRPFAGHQAASRPLLGVQIEGPAGVAALDDILAVAGLDLVFVGPYDLAQQLGHPGEVSHPEVQAAITDVAARAADQGIATGVWSPDAQTAQVWVEAGIGLVSVGNATVLLADAARSLVAALDLQEGSPGAAGPRTTS